MKKIISTLLLITAMSLSAQTDSIEWISDTTQAADTALNVEEMNGVTSVAQPATTNAQAAAEHPASGLGWLVLACGLATLLAVGAGVMTYLTRREVAELHDNYNKALEQTTNDMRQFAEESAREVNALRAQVIRLSNQMSAARAVPVVHPGRKGDNEPPKRGPQTLYLAKPDMQGCFTRVSQQFELGNSLFVLTTNDDQHGTFVIIDNADVHRFALMMPTDNLTHACTGDGIQLSGGKTRIVTDQPGQATFENGSWRVTRKAVIHYE